MPYSPTPGCNSRASTARKFAQGTKKHAIKQKRINNEKNNDTNCGRGLTLPQLAYALKEWQLREPWPAIKGHAHL